MLTVRSGAQAPARWRAFACGLALLASCMLAATAGAFVPDLPRLFSAELTPDPEAKLPAPTRYSYRGTHTTVVQGVKAPLRIRLEATVPAELGNVLAFYRTELSKLGWQEQRDGAVIAADHVQLAFASPLGPALLELHRKDSSTTVKLVQKNALVATDANVMPEPGQAKLVFANISKTDATLTINEQTADLTLLLMILFNGSVNTPASMAGSQRKISLSLNDYHVGYPDLSGFGVGFLVVLTQGDDGSLAVPDGA
ncbi:hypothetical protein ACVIWV_008019 [Bradyrhizobium diazoefficiens]|nr:hypothetical protein [Bradyrhizobium diazoefficiens]